MCFEWPNSILLPVFFSIPAWDVNLHFIWYFFLNPLVSFQWIIFTLEIMLWALLQQYLPWYREIISVLYLIIFCLLQYLNTILSVSGRIIYLQLCRLRLLIIDIVSNKRLLLSSKGQRNWQKCSVSSPWTMDGLALFFRHGGVGDIYKYIYNNSKNLQNIARYRKCL